MQCPVNCGVFRVGWWAQACSCPVKAPVVLAGGSFSGLTCSPHCTHAKWSSRGPSEISGFSLCVQFSPLQGSMLWTLATLVFWASQFCLFNSEGPLGPIGLPFPDPWSRNGLWAVSWDNRRAHLIHSHLSGTTVFYCFV